MFVSTFIAIKYIQSKKYKFLPSLSFLTSFLGIFLSVFTLIATVSVMEGFKQEFQKTIIGIRPHLKVYFPKVYYGRPETFSDYKQKSIQLAGKEILHSGGGISGEAMVSHNSKISGILFSGLEAEDFLARNILKSSIISGNLEGFNTSEKVIIGSEIAFLLGVKVGDKINLISPNFRETAFGAIPIHKTFTVGGIFKVGMHFYDSSYIFLPAKQAENFLGQKGVNFLEILVTSDTYYQMSKNYMALKKYLKAAIHITKAIEINKYCKEYYLFRGGIYDIMGFKELAEEDRKLSKLL